MNVIEAAFTALAAGLTIWQHKDATKYADKAMKLKKEWYEEFNNPQRDDSVLDNIEFELVLLVNSFSSEISKSVASNKSNSASS